MTRKRLLISHEMAAVLALTAVAESGSLAHKSEQPGPTHLERLIRAKEREECFEYGHPRPFRKKAGQMDKRMDRRSRIKNLERT